MGDCYAEIMVKRKTSTSTKFLKCLMIGITGLCFVCGIIVHPFAFLAGMILILVDYIVFPKMNKEYEYTYINGEIFIDVIYSKLKRKRKESFAVSEIAAVAPLGSKALDAFQFEYDVRDFSSGFEDSPRPLVFVKPDTKEKFHLEITEPKVLQDIKFRLSRNYHEE